MEETKKRKGCLRVAARWGCLPVLVLLVLLAAMFVGAFAPQLYNRYSVYPRQKAQWAKHAESLQPVSLKTGWTEYRGVMHSHSELSHDSEVTFPEILATMHKAKCQFIFLTDHYVEGKADYSLGWRGVHDGVLFVQGFEMDEGFMPWGLPEDTVFSKGDDPAEVARRIRELGGVLALGHNEAPRPWEIPEIDAMEIYNIHSDMIDNLVIKNSRIDTVKDALLNFRAYPEQTFRGFFDPWLLMVITQKWDEQSKHRNITAIAANDCHQNVGLKVYYTSRDTVMLIDTGHTDPSKKITEFKVNFLTRPLLRLFFGKLEPDKLLYRTDLDPYERSSRFVNTHLLAKELTEPALLDALRAGRAFIAFNMLGDAAGFAYVAEGGGKQVTMGESIALSPDLKFRAEAPLDCKFTLVRNGRSVATQDGRTFEFDVRRPGKYRLEAAIPMPGEMTFAGDKYALNHAPWVMTNYIEVLPGETVAASANGM